MQHENRVRQLAAKFGYDQQVENGFSNGKNVALVCHFPIDANLKIDPIVRIVLIPDYFSWAMQGVHAIHCALSFAPIGSRQWIEDGVLVVQLPEH